MPWYLINDHKFLIDLDLVLRASIVPRKIKKQGGCTWFSFTEELSPYCHVKLTFYWKEKQEAAGAKVRGRAAIGVAISESIHYSTSIIDVNMVKR